MDKQRFFCKRAWAIVIDPFFFPIGEITYIAPYLLCADDQRTLSAPCPYLVSVTLSWRMKLITIRWLFSFIEAGAHHNEMAVLLHGG